VPEILEVFKRSSRRVRIQLNQDAIAKSIQPLHFQSLLLHLNNLFIAELHNQMPNFLISKANLFFQIQYV
jgi:hypothetical protein